ncbi:MAG: ribbon-helix-helix protein, CopG family [Candidatus Tenebribacter davisii]|nr:ribbon-helix-helix protein, CopG family [Candidatus Tenebribacter davisii]
MKKTFAVRLSDEQLKNLKKISEQEGRTVSDVLRRMIDESLRKRKIDSRRIGKAT